MVELNKIYHGDSLEILKTFPAESINCVITSPPYWAIRDYKVNGQLGLELTFHEYIEKLCTIFDEVKRVLKKDGTCFVNLGDTYAGSGNGTNDYRTEKSLSINGRGKLALKGFQGSGSAKLSSKAMRHEKIRFEKRDKTNEVPAKCLCQIPSRFAIAMTDRGWTLRNRIVWHKTNAMPSPVTDRFTVDYEEVFFFVKSKKYFFKQLFDPYSSNSDVRYRQALRAGKSYNTKEPYKNNFPYSKNYKRGHGAVVSRGNDGDGLVVGGYNPEGRNKRCIWSIPTSPFKEAHFATFPEKLIEPMILAGCPEGKGIVLDPFMGAGTTAIAAKRLKRNWIGIELNPEYIKIAEKRISKTQEMLLV